MKILALDGATRVSGVAVLERLPGTRVRLVSAEALKLDDAMSMPERLRVFRARFTALCWEHEPDIIAIEDLKFNAGAPNFSSLTKVAFIIGVATEAAYTYLCGDPIMLTASTVRGIIGNTAKKNKKTETRRIINERFAEDLATLGKQPLKGTQEDISDAIALGWASFTKLKG
jgi:Holliday junction resolvasome RuvABC endonuclease subunit